MANYKSFVFNSTNDSQPLVTPAGGRFHVYVSPLGQLQVINHLGQIIPQNFTGGSTSGGGVQAVLSGSNITVGGTSTHPVVGVIDRPVFNGGIEVGSEAHFYGGAIYSSAGPIIFEDGLTSASNCEISTLSGLNYLTFIPQNVLPSVPTEGKMFWSAGTGLMVCTGSTNGGWMNVYIQH